jgi:hypothetical protein
VVLTIIPLQHSSNLLTRKYELLVHTELSSSEAENCFALDETSILNLTSYSKKTSDVFMISFLLKILKFIRKYLD